MIFIPGQHPTSDGMTYLTFRSRFQLEGWSEEDTRTVLGAWEPENSRIRHMTFDQL